MSNYEAKRRYEREIHRLNQDKDNILIWYYRARGNNDKQHHLWKQFLATEHLISVYQLKLDSLYAQDDPFPGL